MEDPQQLLSNCLTDYIIDELRRCNTVPRTFRFRALRMSNTEADQAGPGRQTRSARRRAALRIGTRAALMTSEPIPIPLLTRPRCARSDYEIARLFNQASYVIPVETLLRLRRGAEVLIKMPADGLGNVRE